VQQIITGSIDSMMGVGRRFVCSRAAVFKKLIYEMRFDQVSAVYVPWAVLRRRAVARGESGRVDGKRRLAISLRFMIGVAPAL